MENNEVVVEVIEEVAGATLNKAVVVGTIVAGGALAFVLVPKVYRKVKNLFAKRSVKVTEELPATEETEKVE
jgi:hypothetical protein